ncbi:MAG TPA: mandelate racemase/muconate lactonizing enzyme family protein [Acidimicrobiales bacterium]|nr:mandelate racemase/muconate lactonizing enzyme family protein [Acidimicrobiales bacterium]
MKIKRVTPHSVSYPEPNDSNNTRYLTFCRIEAEDGTVGWGEAISQFPDSTRATARIIEAMGEAIVGADPMENVAIWRRLHEGSWWYGYRGGPASFAISAIDIALWDLKGKLLGQPVVNLIGGAYRERLPAIASTHAFDESLEVEAEKHGRYVRSDGYRGVKVGMGKRGKAHLGYEIARDVEFVRLLREAIGPDALLIMDRGQSLVWTRAEAIRRTNAFEEYGLYWIEEPMEPTDIAGFQSLRSQVKCMIGTGEREWNARGFAEVISSGVADVIGCDPGRAEGITGSLKVIELVEAADIWFNAHAWSSAVVSAASLALSASTPRCLLFELKPIENPMQHELVDEPFSQTDGWISVPRRPGLGVEVKESVLEKYRFD